MLKHFFSTLLGLAVAMLCVPAVGVITQRIWPPPEGISPASDAETLRAAIVAMPLGALLAVAGSWVLGTFAGGLIASWISGSRVPPFVIGGFIVLAAVSSLTSIPYPAWFWIVALVLVPAAAWVASRLGPKRAAAA